MRARKCGGDSDLRTTARSVDNRYGGPNRCATQVFRAYVLAKKRFRDRNGGLSAIRIRLTNLTGVHLTRRDFQH